MIFREIQISADETIFDRFETGFVQKFNIACCCITDMFAAAIQNKLRTPDVGKVFMKFEEARDTPPRIFGKCLGVLEIGWPFAFAPYSDTSDSFDQKCQIFRAMTAALILIASRENWNPQPIESATSYCLEKELRFEGISKKSWLSPKKLHRARIYFEYRLDRVDLYAVVFRNRSSKEIAREFLGSGVPSLGCLHNFLNNGEWVSDFAFCVFGSDFRRQKWLADFSKALM